MALGPARVLYCASPRYIRAHGAPRVPRELAEHECILLGGEGAVTRWPVRAPSGTSMIAVQGRLAFSSFAMAREAALAGLGIAVFPEPACREEIRRRRLVPVLDGEPIEVGSIWLLHVARRFLPARVRAFVDLARERFASQPWRGRSDRAVASRR